MANVLSGELREEEKSVRNSQRDLFEELSFNLLSYLESRPGISGVQFKSEPPISKKSLQNWEKENKLLLPKDLVYLLSMFNGFLIRWQVRLGSEEFPLGCIHLNPLESFKKINMYNFRNQFKKAPYEQMLQHKKGKFPVGFTIDSSCVDGFVALVYLDDEKPPEVWFKDVGLKWNILATSFSSYFRILLLHLGIARWQYIFTEQGLDQVSYQWINYFAKSRLEIDENSGNKEEKIKK